MAVSSGRIVIANRSYQYSRIFIILVTSVRVILETIGGFYCRFMASITEKNPSILKKSQMALFMENKGNKKKSVRFAANKSWIGTIKPRVTTTGGFVKEMLLISLGKGQTVFERITNNKDDWQQRSSPSRRTVTSPTNALLMLSAAEMAEKILLRKVTCRDLLDAHVRRLREVDEELHCIAHDNFQEAADTADSIDAGLAQLYCNKHLQQQQRDEEKLQRALEKLKRDKPLLGVPFTCKESFSVKGLPYAVGLKWRLGVVGEDDADVISAMREAGAILMSTTTVPEMSFWWETRSSVRETATRNPHDVRRTSGGSSGGEGAAVASCGSPLGVGSDYYGSIRFPAAFNGVCGHKPSAGLCSLKGHFPYTESAAAVAGPLGRSVKDLALALTVLSRGRFSLSDTITSAKGRVNRDVSSAAMEAARQRQKCRSQDYIKARDDEQRTENETPPPASWTVAHDSKSCIRFLFLENFSPLWYRGIPHEVKRILTNLKHLLQKLGHTCEEVEVPALNFGAEIFLAMEADDASGSESPEQSCDPRDFLIKQITKSPGRESRDQDEYQSQQVEKGERANVFLELAKKALGRESDFCLPTLLSCAAVATAKNDIARKSKFFQDMRKMKKLLETNLEELLAKNTVLLMPTAPHVAPFHQQSYFMPALLCYTGIFNVLGLPVTQIPMQQFQSAQQDHRVQHQQRGAEASLPIGLQIIGWKYQDGLTLKAAEIIESLGGKWTPPWKE